MGEEKFYKQTTLPSFEKKVETKVEIPDKIGPFKVETLLAKGGMSLLYLGLDLKLREPRVIKVLSPQYLNHPEMIDHFLWEAKIIALANHPNIVKLYDHGKWEGGLYIAIEFIQGISLRQFLMQQSLSLKRCLDIILQTAYALCHLHTHGVIHRDLKPENILITEEGEVKVIDFGIAQMHEDDPKRDSQMIGTPSYMSPEQKENPLKASFSSDIFSLGVIAYELILGKLSYGMINLSLLPTGLQKILGKTLAISPSERYQDIVAFITDLTDYYKSPASTKERPTTDQLIEWTEKIRQADLSLSQFEKPNWPTCDIGIAKDRSKDQLGFYLDFFRFANNTMAIVQAHTNHSTLASTAHIALLSGMVKALLHPYKQTEEALDPVSFITKLNQLVCEDSLSETFHFNLLKIIPYNDTLIYISCGLSGPLFHTPQGKQKPRIIHDTNPLLGEDPTTSFVESSDTFSDGDLLFFHNLPEGPFAEPLGKWIKENTLLSPIRLSSTLLEKAATVEIYQKLAYPKCAITLQRLG